MMVEWKRGGFSTRNFFELKIKFHINSSCKIIRLENLKKALVFPEAIRILILLHKKYLKNSVNKKYQNQSQNANYKMEKYLVSILQGANLFQI